MKIALNAQLLSRSENYRSAGVSGYSLALLRELGALRESKATRSTFHAYIHDPGLEIPGVVTVVSRLPLQRPLLRIAWEQAWLPTILAQGGYDLVHGLVNVLPLASTARDSGLVHLPGVVTVHDLSFVRMPEVLPPTKRAYLTALCRRSAWQAQRVIAVSRQTADDLVESFDLPSTKIDVIPNGVGKQFVPGTAAASAAFRRRKALPERFLLYVGTLEPRKNLEMLVRAFAHFRAASPDDADVQLVIVGGKGWYYETVFGAVRELGLEQQVRFVGFVSGEELPDWYRAALGFVYPSRFEGFGLPVLEAMACGTPVIISTAPSLLEVAGDAALAVPATDEVALADALALLVGQPALQEELRRRGLTRASAYSWERTARETMEVYEQAVK